MSKITATDRSVLFQMRDQMILFEPYGPDTIRVRATRNGTFSDESWTLLPPLPSGEVTAFTDGQTASLTVGSLKMELWMIWNQPHYRFLRDGKEILHSREEGDQTMKYVHTGGDNYRVRAMFEAKEGEHFYGLGQEQQPCLDRKGTATDIIHYNTKSTLPGVYSSLGYYFLWNNPSPGRVDLGRNHTLWQSDSAYQVDYILAAAATPAFAMRRYAELTGFSPEMPPWAAGFWQCKLRYESQDDLLDVARKYHQMGVPVDAIVIDYFHWTEQGNWEFEPSLWPDPKAMCDELYSMNIRPVVSIWPTINPASKNWGPMNDENMLVRTENGQYGTFDFYGQQTFIDPTNPRTREYVWEQVKKNYYDYGIRTFWLDEAEPEVHPQQFGHLRFHIGNGAQMAMLYPYYYCKTFYDGLKSVGETEIVSLTRAAYPGSQKFGAIVWNGDIPSTWQALRESVVSGLSMGMCGIPWWNSDIGGFFFGDIESDFFRELIVRWFQFGLFCPVMRLHGSRNRTKNQVDRHPGVKERSGGDNEIWSFGERNTPILADLIHLRQRMKPYVLRCAKASSQTGEPIMRPMFFDFPEDDICYTLDDQYMFGPDILFAPILESGVTERQVYLPKSRWVSARDKTVLEGGRTVTCHAELHEFIAFVREGAEVAEIF
ncbi:MAG: hypothetical protein J6K72_10290 [Clostridia bacterium]|nr:hypothetical protein [Clostridia bacterium]